MAYSFNWNDTFEDVPGDSDAISGGAEVIRNLKEAIQERIAHDHYMAIDGTQADHGEHQLIVFHEPESSYPVPGENKGALYTKNVSDKAELHWTDEDGTSIQITSGGEILAAVPSGGIIEWSGASDAIPNGYYLCDGTNGTPDLRGVFVIGAGGDYDVGATGGEATHALIADEIPPHLHGFTHGMERPGNISGAICMTWNAGSYTKNTELSTGGGTAHNNLPPYYALCKIMKS